MTLQDYQMLLPREERLHASHPDLGILCTSLTHEIDGDNNNIYIPKDELEHPQVVGTTEAGTKRKRQLLYRYKLKDHTDLSRYNMAVVFDNSSQYHCKLIRESNIYPEITWIWQKSPLRLWPSNRPILADNVPALDDEVRRRMDPPTNALHCYIKGGWCLGFPAVAALFELHNFMIKASAEPVPLDTVDDEKQHQMFLALLVLYHSCDSLGCSEKVQWAIEELESEKYVVEHVDTSCQLTLLHAIERVHNDIDSSEWDNAKLGLDPGMDPYEILIDGEIFLKECQSQCEDIVVYLVRYFKARE
eukprot:scaffold305646_cov65-Attheya_sp.AAC.1